jgi:endonuclease YncB( thermonuclease family)
LQAEKREMISIGYRFHLGSLSGTMWLKVKEKFPGSGDHVFLAFTLLAAASTSCTVVDGDTLRCGPERIRLLGIDAPDDPSNGRCRPYAKPGAICDARLAAASKAALRQIMTGPLRVMRISTDGYGRTLAMVYVRGRSLSCLQLEAGRAIYKPKWDNGQIVAGECPRAAYR